AKDGTIKIHRTLPDHTPCAICGTTQTPIWRKRPDNTVICNGCSLISKQSRSLDFSHGVEAQPFPSPPQSAYSGSAVYTPGKKARERSRGKGSVTSSSTHSQNRNEGDDFGRHKRSRYRNSSAVTDGEARKRREEGVLEFYSGYNSDIGAEAEVAAVAAAAAAAAGSTNGPHHCNLHGGYGSCTCSQYFGASVGPSDGRPGPNAAIGSATDTLSTIPLEATITQ
ncbi:hypothetical protein BGZ75_004755, partial [Mortierella antarctica]